MSPSSIPDWVLLELQDWMHARRTGTLGFEFNGGVPQRIQRGEVVIPPREVARATDPAVPKLPSQRCPVDGGVMAERDYGEKFQCSVCFAVYPIWDLRKRGKLVTADE